MVVINSGETMIKWWLIVARNDDNDKWWLIVARNDDKMVVNSGGMMIELMKNGGGEMMIELILIKRWLNY
jgi:hypothetical protein